MRPFTAYLLVLVLCGGLGTPLYAQAVHPSLYLGLGSGTNLGGTAGAGVEVRIGGYLSANLAAGVWPEALRQDRLDGSPFDFDLGAKLYPFRRWLFLGLNYGLIHSALYTSFETQVFEKTRGFTLSLGLRMPAYRRGYLSGYIGVTDDADANHIRVFDRRDFMPHLGLMLGYELQRTRQTP